MTLRVWWATELYPDNSDENIGIAGDFQVLRLDDLRGVVEGLREIADDCRTVSEDQAITIAERRTWRVMQRKALHLLAQLKEVDDANAT